MKKKTHAVCILTEIFLLIALFYFQSSLNKIYFHLSNSCYLFSLSFRVRKTLCFCWRISVFAEFSLNSTNKLSCVVQFVSVFISWAVPPSAAFWHPLCWGSHISSGCQPTSVVLFYGSVTPRQLACKPPLKNRYMVFMMS